MSWRKIKSAGLRNKVIQNKLKEYVPIKDVMLRICIWFEKLYAIKFQGKPPKIELLTNSIKEKNIEKINIDGNFLSNEKKEQASVAIP